MSDDARQHLIKLLSQFDDGMLTTQGRDGSLHSRPMAIAAVDKNADLWLATDVHSEKVDEVAHDAHIAMTMQAGQKYVTVSGKAKVVRDAARVHAMWTEAWRVWVPKGPDDPGLVLLHLKTSRGEFWDNEGANRVTFLYEAAQAYLTGTTPPPNKALHSKVDDL